MTPTTKIQCMERLPAQALALAASLLLGCGAPVADRTAPEERFSVVRAMAAADVAGFERAIAPRDFTFPADHGPHPDFQLEWWYFVGNLTAVGPGPEAGRRFGWQLTFFRLALAPDAASDRRSAWASRDVYMAHFAVTDVDGGRFRSRERFSRAAAGLAGARAAPFVVWLDDWQVASTGEGFLPLRLRARDGTPGPGGLAVDLTLDGRKPLVLQGDDGLSRKSPAPGNASYYYSYTRLDAGGTVMLAGDVFEVEGSGWLDREWSTSGLEVDQVGWDWFALQLDDGRDLMFYQLRRRDGTVEPLSHGSLVAADGSKRLLRSSDVELEVLRTWRSSGGTEYPAGWRLRVAGLDLEIVPFLADQELDATFRYWEGAVAVRRRDGTPAGRGYVELVGYGPRPAG